MKRITADEFARRLPAVCLQRGTPGLPRKRRDLLILLVSIARTLDTGRSYSEPELNDAIKLWQTEIGRDLDSDHVTLRRCLVDDQLLGRDAAGASYTVLPDTISEIVEPEVLSLDQPALLAAAAETRESRRREQLGKGSSDQP